MALPPVGCLQTGTWDADPTYMESRQTDTQTWRRGDTQMDRHGGEETYKWTDMEERRHTDEQTWRGDTQMNRHGEEIHR